MPLRSLLSTALVGLVVLSGCRIEKPATVVPSPPSIDAFTVSAASARAGDKVTLSWKVSQATAIELREASTGALSVAADSFEGSVEATITANALFVLTARGPGGTDARALAVTLQDAAQGEVTFEALPPTIVGGASTTLVWNAPGATAVSLAAGTQSIDVRGQRGSGAVTVTPDFDTTYTLTADGQTRVATVTVQPAVLSLDASPRAAEVGDSITLSWTAAGADRLVVSSPGRGQLAEITDPARIRAGSFVDVVPALPANGLLTYEVAAVKGTATLSKQVEVFIGTGLTITRFDAPAVAAAGATYSVRWQTVAADSIELLLDGTVVHRSASAAEALTGVFSFTAPAADFAIELVASNTRGAQATRLAQVDSVGVPTSATLTASPTTVSAGGAVTLTFASQEARRTRIVDAAGQTVFSVTGQLAENGTATVYPSQTTTYTLTADNLLGSTPVTATAAVTVTGAALTLTQFPPTAVSGQNVQLNTTQAGALFYGFAHGQVLRSSQADFLDIKATGQRVLESGANVTSVDLPFATWLWGKRQTGPLTISRAGWMAWGAPLVVNSTETTLPSTSTTAAPALIAPFWDNLTLTANSAVFAQLVGDAPEQSLVVQWDTLQVGTTTTTEVTFQVRVHQNGVVSFHYKTMNLSSSTYSSFTTGVQDDTRSVALSSTTTPTSNSALYFFSPVTGPVNVRVVKGSTWGGLVKVGDVATLISRPATALAIPGDLAVTELMFRPAAAVPNGQYLELFNRTPGPLDLTSWELRSSAGSAFPVGSGFTLQPGVTVFGGSTDPLENDDAGVAVSWGTFTLSPDAGTLTFANPDAGLVLNYSGPDDGGTGVSLELDPTLYLARSGTPPEMSCPATQTFGGQSPLQQGSPGRIVTCFGYLAQSIPARYVDISATGTRLINGTTAVDSRTIPITLAATAGDPAPVAFGVRRPVVSMSTSGWIAWGSITTSGITNKTLPSSTAPVGVVAPFWDFLETTPGLTSPSDLYWKRFAANEDPATPAPHWVFMWHHFRHVAGDDLNFEVKLFENGTIEYHYATMASGSSTNYGDGNSATVWLEEPTGFRALAQSVNDPVVAPNTAWRFSPQ